MQCFFIPFIPFVGVLQIEQPNDLSDIMSLLLELLQLRLPCSKVSHLRDPESQYSFGQALGQQAKLTASQSQAGTLVPAKPTPSASTVKTWHLGLAPSAAKISGEKPSVCSLKAFRSSNPKLPKVRFR